MTATFGARATVVAARPHRRPVRPDRPLRLLGRALHAAAGSLRRAGRRGGSCRRRPERPIQLIDARTTRWMVTLAERDVAGTYNAISPPRQFTMGDLVEVLLKPRQPRRPVAGAGVDRPRGAAQCRHRAVDRAAALAAGGRGAIRRVSHLVDDARAKETRGLPPCARSRPRSRQHRGMARRPLAPGRVAKDAHRRARAAALRLASGPVTHGSAAVGPASAGRSSVARLAALGFALERLVHRDESGARRAVERRLEARHEQSVELLAVLEPDATRASRAGSGTSARRRTGRGSGACPST